MLTRARSEAGMTLAELMIAMVLLLVGVLATFVMLDVANQNESAASAREGATNLAREVLEDAHDVQYAQVGSSGWLQSRLQTISGGSGTVTLPNSYTEQTTVTRRNVSYSVTLTNCSVDDGRDGYGTHAVTTNWCSDSSSTGTSDSQPEDLKRVTASLSWSDRGVTRTLSQTITFGSSGAAIGPPVTSLTITQPAGLPSSNPVITSNPPGNIVTFYATSPGAADMKFSVNGVDQVSGITAVSGGWNFNWDISNLKDGTYVIAATAIDALGTRGQSRSISVTLSRGAPGALANLTGGYNYVYISGTKTLVVELAWDANAEGSVTGYEVDKGATTVCGGQTSLATACMDTSPATSGSTTYTVKTWYRSSAGSMQSISTTYVVTAPSTGSVATRYWLTSTSQTVATAHCDTGFIWDDLLPTSPTGATTFAQPGTMVGCTPALPSTASLAAGTVTVDIYAQNTGSKTCTTPWWISHNASPTNGGTVIGTTNSYTVPANTSTYTKITSSASIPATTLVANDQIVLFIDVATATGSCSKNAIAFGSAADPTDLQIPSLSNSGTTLSQPAAPTGLAITHNADGTNTLTWNAATGTPAPDFYRIYRDGQNYTNRYDTAGDTGAATISWTDTATGGTTHTYYVTTAAATLTESATMAGPVS